MRKEKHPDLQAVRWSGTFTPSILAFLKKDLGFSRKVQRYVCEEVTGMTYKEFRTHLCIPRGEGFASTCIKGEPSNKAFLRATRWILESDISFAGKRDNKIYLRVVWHLSKSIAQVVIDLDKQYFSHVIYDEALPQPFSEITDEMVEEFNTWIASVGDAGKGGRGSQLILTPKAKILWAWYRNSFDLLAN